MDYINPLDGEIASRYTFLTGIRDPFLTRCYKYSRVTIPSLLPEEEDSSTSEMLLDYSTIGAEYVNHLANTYVDEMFPSHRTFFKLVLPEDEKIETAEEDGITTSEVDQAFNKTEKEARSVFDKRHGRVAVLDGLKHLIVTGNTCLYWPPDGGLVQNYAMDQYVVWRDNSGKLLELITEDKRSLLSLEPEMREKVIMALPEYKPGMDEANEFVTLYTYIRRNPENTTEFLVDQSVEQINIGEQVSYPQELLPWMPLYWNRTRREVWGRGLVEDHYGGFFALSILTEALVTAGAIATDFKFLVKPGSMVDIVELNNSASGTYHYGNPEDVQPVDLGKRTELQFVSQLVDMYTKRLGKVFLVLSSQMRDAERVTAEENRLRAQELNKAHGGVFGVLGLTLQAPTAELLLRDLDVVLKGSTIKPIITTGLDAMGRSSENEKILAFFGDLAGLQAVPEPFLQGLKITDLMRILGTGRDIDTSIIMSAKELQQAQAAQAEAEARRSAVDSMNKQASPEALAEGLAQ